MPACGLHSPSEQENSKQKTKNVKIYWKKLETKQKKNIVPVALATATFNGHVLPFEGGGATAVTAPWSTNAF
jgi:hypothetical protein